MATISHEVFQGYPCVRITLAGGDSALVALHGAHVLSWTSRGRERLYLSPGTVWDGHAAIRGGIPVCFPQFNMRGDLPRHGFVRNLPWSLDTDFSQGSGGTLRMRLASDAATHALWPHDFAISLDISLAPGQFTITLDVHNPGAHDLHFSGALHTYLAVSDLPNTVLVGLGGQAEWDAVRDTHGVGAERLQFSERFDRVYAAPAGALHLQDPSGPVEISHSPSWANWVVWNPGEELSNTMPDLVPDSYQHMLCVEAAQVFEKIAVPPDAHWQGWQRMRLAD
jgi:glucose-6-phosphate 1-epimerase